VACPFFLPTEKLANGTWLHPGRLPLGCGWSGQCTAPGHEGETPAEEELRDFCNLGYAEGCARLPKERVWDSVRFGARTVNKGDGTRDCIQIRYVCERGHRPVECGILEFDVAEQRWERAHCDSRVQRMAECFVESHMAKRRGSEGPHAAAS